MNTLGRLPLCFDDNTFFVQLVFNPKFSYSYAGKFKLHLFYFFTMDGTWCSLETKFSLQSVDIFYKKKKFFSCVMGKKIQIIFCFFDFMENSGGIVYFDRHSEYYCIHDVVYLRLTIGRRRTICIISLEFLFIIYPH